MQDCGSCDEGLSPSSRTNTYGARAGRLGRRLQPAAGRFDSYWPLHMPGQLICGQSAGLKNQRFARSIRAPGTTRLQITNNLQWARTWDAYLKNNYPTAWCCVSEYRKLAPINTYIYLFSSVELEQRVSTPCVGSSSLSRGAIHMPTSFNGQDTRLRILRYSFDYYSGYQKSASRWKGFNQKTLLMAGS